MMSRCFWKGFAIQLAVWAMLAAGSVAAEVSLDEPFLEYERIQPMAPAPHNRFVLRWWTDGRVEIHIPAYARNGGVHQLSIGDYDIDLLEEVLDTTDRLHASLQSVPETVANLRSAEVKEVFDADTVRLRTHAASRGPVDVELTSPEYWARTHPQHVELATLAELDQRLLEWMMVQVSANL